MSHKLFNVIAQLENRRIHFVISRHRKDSIMLTCTLVGRRIEIDVFEDGHIEYSYFKGDEGVESNEADMWKLVNDFS